MFMEYKNSLGSVIMSGASEGDVSITQTDGFGIVQRQYMAATFAEYDGQETLSSKALPRCITLGLEVRGRDISQKLSEILRILARPGYLILGEKTAKRQIYCNQSIIPDPQRVLRGRIATLGVQFICDRPYFEDAERTVCSLYRRTKELTNPFSLPSVLGRTYSQAEISNNGDISAQPVIRIVCPNELEEAESLVISNLTTGKEIGLSFTPQAGEEIIIDVPNRRIEGSVGGNMLNALTDETYLGEFVLVPGVNLLRVTVGGLESGFVVECTFSNLHSEAVIV